MTADTAAPRGGEPARIDLGPGKYDLGRRLNAIVTASRTWEEAAERAAALFATPPAPAPAVEAMALPENIEAEIAALEQAGNASGQRLRAAILARLSPDLPPIVAAEARLPAHLAARGPQILGAAMGPAAEGQDRAIMGGATVQALAAKWAAGQGVREALEPIRAYVDRSRDTQCLSKIPDDERMLVAFRDTGPAGSVAITMGDLRRLAALASAEADGGWLPIETAPRDGTRVLATDDKDPTRTWVVWFDRNNKRLVTSHHEGMVLGLTHWRLLPAPPTPTATDAARSDGQGGDDA